MKKDTLIFDLDGTICRPKHQFNDSQRRYGEAEPIPEMIAKMQKCYRTYNIVIYTGRRMLTHNGYVAAIEADVRQLTLDWLKRHDVPCDNLVFGKPFGKLYIDDRGMHSEDFIKSNY